MGSRVRVVALLLSVFTLTTTLGAGVAHADDVGGTPAEVKPRFVTRCTFSHRLADDPIVHFKQPGASHLHDFFGNTTTNAKSTLARLKKGGTTCKNQKDLSGYWTPSLKVNGTIVDPTQVSVYYSSAGKDFTKIKAPKPGLKIVAGSAMATAPQGMKITSWDCADDNTVLPGVDVPTCPMGTLALHVNFPDCWDGVNLDSADHASHLAYHDKGGVCPATHPVLLPRIRVNVRYPTTGGPTTVLASGGQYSGHADFFNAWDPKELKRLVKTCINAGITCNANA
jgi:Domain of unknown function (DUF1996)